MKTEIDSFSDDLILTFKNGNIVLVPFLGENKNGTRCSTKNEYDNYYFLECNIKNERKENETFKFTSKLSFNWKNNIKNFKSKQFNKYNKSKKYHY